LAGAGIPPWIAGAAALAFVASTALGYYVASDAGKEEPAPAAQTGSSVVYKIPVTMSQPTLGPADALVTIVQWCNLLDPGCARAEPTVQALLKQYPKQVRLVFRHYLDPAAQPGASLAHQFARIAHEQHGKFWEARALLLGHRGAITESDLERYAGQLGLDWASVKKGLDGGGFAGSVAADRVFAGMFDVKAPPAFFANGRPLVGAASEHLEPLVKEELARAREAMAKGVQRTDLYAELTKNGVWTPPTVPKPAQ
jgi:protein-disulfide isomerase